MTSNGRRSPPPSGWGNAIAIGVGAWIVAAIILYLLGAVGVVAPDALGIPDIRAVADWRLTES